MPKGREELRRGVRGLVEAASREMHALVEEAAATDDRRLAAPEPPEASAEPKRVPPVEAAPPLLRLMRDPPRPGDAPGGPTVPKAVPGPVPIPAFVHPSRGVCVAYLVNPSCWEVPDAYCNQALQVCMLRACPVFSLHRKELERRFATKFAHLW